MCITRKEREERPTTYLPFYLHLSRALTHHNVKVKLVQSNNKESHVTKRGIILLSWSYIGIMVRMFTNGPGDRGSIPGQVIPKTQKMVLDASLLNTQHCKVCIKGGVKQSREKSSVPPHTHLSVIAIEKGVFGSSSPTVTN